MKMNQLAAAREKMKSEATAKSKTIARKIRKKNQRKAQLTEWTTWMMFIFADASESLDEGDNGSVGGEQSGKGVGRFFVPILEFGSVIGSWRANVSHSNNIF